MILRAKLNELLSRWEEYVRDQPDQGENYVGYYAGHDACAFQLRAVLNDFGAGTVEVGEAGAGPVGEALAFVMQYGGRCRDCGDCNGYCQDEGLPCNSAHRERIIRHVLEAVEYGRAHGFLARPVEEPGEVDRLTRERDALAEALEKINSTSLSEVYDGRIGEIVSAAREVLAGRFDFNAHSLKVNLARETRRAEAAEAVLAETREAINAALRRGDVGSHSARVLRAALTGDAQDGEPGASFGARHSIAHDGFVGTVIGHYTRLDGKRGVVLQQDGTKVVHVYGEKWLAPAGDAQEARRSPDVSMWGRWFPHDEAPGGSYACLYRNGELPVSLAWMPAQGRPNMPDTVVMPFPMPGDAQEANR